MKHAVLLENIHGEIAEIFWYGCDSYSWDEIEQVSLKIGDIVRLFPTAESAYQWAMKHGFRE